MTNPPTPASGEVQIVLLGLCERANYIQELNTNIFKWNVLGLKTVVLSHIFPFKVDEFKVGFAFLPSRSNQETSLRLVSDSGEEVGTLNFSSKVTPPDSNDSTLKSYSQVFLPEHGWTTVFLPLHGTNWVIEAPGVYYLEQVLNDKPIQIGALEFVAVDAAPLSPEQITAIKSEPNATKAVRIELGCKHCSSKLHAYAGLERNEKTEREGWIWYQEVPEIFKCECGKSTIDLQYIRRNLHGLLGHRQRENDQLSFMPLYEKSSLESIRTNFARTIARSPREELLQQFIDKNPILLHQFPAQRIIPKPPILTSYVADFGIITPQKELILIELEKTTTRLMNKNGDIAAPLNHAFDQVRNWLHVIDEHRLAVLDSLAVTRETVSSIRGIVIAGRDIGYDARDLRKLKGANFGNVTFLTYDDLLFAMDALIQRVESI